MAPMIPSAMLPVTNGETRYKEMPESHSNTASNDGPSDLEKTSEIRQPNRDQVCATNANDTFQGISDEFSSSVTNGRHQHMVKASTMSAQKKRQVGDVPEVLSGGECGDTSLSRTKKARKSDDSSVHSSDESSLCSVDDSEERHDEVDPATVEGQLSLHPRMTQDQAKTAAKREYNRRNAARARLRSKEMVQDLQVKVSELTKFIGQLQRENEMLRAQLEILKSQNSNVPREREAIHPPTAQQNPTSQPPIPNTTNLLSLIQNLQKPVAPANFLSIFGAPPQSTLATGTSTPSQANAAASVTSPKANALNSAPQNISIIQASEQPSPLQLLLNNNTSSLLAMAHQSLMQSHASLENNDAVHFAKKLADMMQTPTPISAPPTAGLNVINNDLIQMVQQLMKARGFNATNPDVSPKAGEGQPMFQSLSPQTLYTIFRDQKGESGDQAQNPR